MDQRDARPDWQRYGLAIAASAAGLLAALALGSFITPLHTLALVLPVVAAYQLGGMGPGLLSQVLCTLLAMALLWQPAAAADNGARASALALYLTLTLLVALVVTARARARASDQQRMAQLESLHEVAQSLNRAASLDEVCAAAVASLRRALGADRAALLLADRDGIMRFRAWHGLSDSYRQAVEGHSPWAPGDRNPRPVVVPDALRDRSLEALRGVLEAEGLRSLVFIPLRHDGRLLGKAMVYFNQRRHLSQPDLHLGQIVASQVAFAVERAQAQDERARFGRQLAGLAQASAIIGSRLSLEGCLQAVTEQARAIIGAHLAATSLLNDADWSRALSKVDMSDDYKANSACGAAPDGAGVYALVCETGQPLRLTQAQLEAHPRFAGPAGHEGQPPLRGLLAAPLVGRNGQTMGLIQVSDKLQGEFSADDESILVQLARLASVALENVQLYGDSLRTNADLEARVAVRTAALYSMNAALKAEIAERRQAEAKIRQSEHRLAQAQELGQMGSWHWDVPAGDFAWSDALYRLLGYTPREMAVTFEAFLDHLHPDDRQALHQAVSQALADHQPFGLTHRVRRRDGVERMLHTRGEVLAGQAGSAATIMGISQDVTERSAIEAELRHSREQLRLLSGRLDAAREAERARMAREIHDELGGSLTAIKMEAAQLRRYLDQVAELQPSQVAGSRGQPPAKPGPGATRADPGLLLERTGTIFHLVDSTIRSVRRIAMDLRPAILDDFGLQAAIEWQLSEFEARTGISCRLDSNAGEVALPPETTTVLYRLVQEALSNVARHSAATRVEVRLQAGQGQLRVDVRDNGRGIGEHEIAGAGSLGLLGMRERVRALSGALDIGGAPGQGTLVSAIVPIAS
jgi:two-component system, NarL family, sensor histidine kinase UhpB